MQVIHLGTKETPGGGEVKQYGKGRQKWGHYPAIYHGDDWSSVVILRASVDSHSGIPPKGEELWCLYTNFHSSLVKG